MSYVQQRPNLSPALHFSSSYLRLPILLVTLVAAFILTSSTARAQQTINAGDTEGFVDALSSAHLGDTIVLTAGQTYDGPFTLPRKDEPCPLNRTCYITIRTSTPDSSLPSASSRISPNDAPLLPKLLSPGGGQAALETAAGAHHYRLIGIEIRPTTATNLIYDLVELGNGDSSQNTLDKVPHHLIFDRCLITAFPTQTLKRGISLQSAETTIQNCYIAGFKSTEQDAQAVGGWNGPGPFHILNNYLEASGENLMFGGSIPAIAGLVPSNIEIRGNYLYKPMSWREGEPTYAGVRWSVKNLFELKSAKHVIFEGNILENCWSDVQSGYGSINLTVAGDSGPQATIEDVTIRNNIVKHVSQGIKILGQGVFNGSQTLPTQTGHDIRIENNLFMGIGQLAGDGYFVQICDMAAVVVDHNTVIHDGNMVNPDPYSPQEDRPSTGFVFTNNVIKHNQFGIIGPGSQSGMDTINRYLPGARIEGNVIIGSTNYPFNASAYPTGNFFQATTINEVGFRDLSHSNYRLADNSPFSATANPNSFSDDFNDNRTDAAKWTIGVLNFDNGYDSAIPVMEQSQRLVISPRVTNNTSFSGYVSAKAYSFVGMSASVQVRQKTNAGAYTVFAVGFNAGNWYRIYTTENKIIFEDLVGWVDRHSTEMDYNDKEHLYWRIRHESATNKVNFETSPNGEHWTVRRQVNCQISLSAVKMELDAGTLLRVTNPGQAIFDDFQLAGSSNLVADAGANISAVESVAAYTDLNTTIAPVAPSNAKIESHTLLRCVGEGKGNLQFVITRNYVLSWNDNSNNETNFRIERSPTSNPTSWTPISNLLDQNVTQYNIPSGEDSSYNYRVRAVNSIDVSQPSNQALYVGESGSSLILSENNPAIQLAEDFADNQMNSTKWQKGVLSVAQSSYNASVTALEQNQRLEVTPIANASAPSYNGYVSASTYNFTGGRAAVQVPQVPSGGTALAVLTVGIDSNNWYRISTSGGQIYFEDMVGGVTTSSNIPYDAVAHRYWQIRHYRAHNIIFFETSEDGTNWVARRTITPDLPLTAMRIELGGGTFESVDAPGTAVFDDFYFEADSARFNPSGLVAIGNSAPQVTLTWTAPTDTTVTGYKVERCQSFSQNCFTYLVDAPASTPTVTYTDSSVSPGTAYLYRVRGVIDSSHFTEYSNIDLATTISFTDDPLNPTGTRTIIKAQHLIELRQAVNAVRAAAGLSAASWTYPDPVPTPGLRRPLYLEDVTELRTKLDEALNLLGLQQPHEFNPILARGGFVSAAHFTQIRERVK